jgi:TatD DNase family protein
MATTLVDLHVHGEPARADILAVRNCFPEEPPPSFGPFTVGLHPWHVDPARLAADLVAVAAGARHPRCLAVGECGLDHRCATPRADQEEALAAQVAIARAADLPLVVHCVHAWPEIVAARQAAAPPRPWVIHGFRGNRELACDLVRHGFMLSFGPALLAAVPLREAFAAIPPESLFLETDAAPDADLAALYREAASIRGMAVDDLARQIVANLARLGGKSPRR